MTGPSRRPAGQAHEWSRLRTRGVGGGLAMLVLLGSAVAGPVKAQVGPAVAGPVKAQVGPAVAGPGSDRRDIHVQSIDLRSTLTGGAGASRGPALAVLDDGTLLLGGGPRGGTVIAFRPQAGQPRVLGDLLKPAERLDDSRFAITDIAVLDETPERASLLVSYPRYQRGKRCVEVVVTEVAYNRTEQRITPGATWFTGEPCVPVSAVQHAAGRLLAIDANTAYLTIGDLGYPGIGDRGRRGDLGTVQRISRGGPAVRISQGHRNAQGIALVDGTWLVLSEHGPRGGDELNLIRGGRDYGWPFVTLGEPYSAGDYVTPERTGTHTGYTPPLTHWVPSIAPTAVVQLPRAGDWAAWRGALLMGTLRAQSLIRIDLDLPASGGTGSGSAVGEVAAAQVGVARVTTIPVGRRVRDMAVTPAGVVYATTDEGDLLRITARQAR